MRRNCNPSERATACESVVLPTPGTSSINKCPRARRQATASEMASCLPTIISLICETSASMRVFTRWECRAGVNACRGCVARSKKLYRRRVVYLGGCDGDRLTNRSSHSIYEAAFHADRFGRRWLFGLHVLSNALFEARNPGSRRDHSIDRPGTFCRL